MLMREESARGIEARNCEIVSVKWMKGALFMNLEICGKKTYLKDLRVPSVKLME